MGQDPFGNPFQSAFGLSASDIFRRPAGGGARGPRKPVQAVQTEPEPLAPETPSAAEEARPADRVTLKNSKWEVEAVGFNEEADISVEAALPEPQAHKTRIDFELFAKTPQGPESISKCQGTVKDGKAVGRIPVYFPQYRDEDGNLPAKVEYFFTARHSCSDLFKDEKAVKTVEYRGSAEMNPGAKRKAPPAAEPSIRDIPGFPINTGSDPPCTALPPAPRCTGSASWSAW